MFRLGTIKFRTRGKITYLKNENQSRGKLEKSSTVSYLCVYLYTRIEYCRLNYYNFNVRR